MDACGQIALITAWTVTDSGDRRNRVTAVVNVEGENRYSYNRNSLLKRIHYASGATADYSYDAASRITALSNQHNSAVVSSYSYRYDANGNRLEQTEQNGFGEESTTYVYDRADRLTEVVYPDQHDTYTYDPAWNRVTETVADSQGTLLSNKVLGYNSRNQLTDITDSVDAANNATFGYDEIGNQVTKVKDGITTSYVYDARNHLREVTTGGSTVGQFLYDYRGLRTEKQGDRGTERYSYDDQSVLFQSDASNAPTAKYEYGPNRLLSLKQTGLASEFYLFDALRSPVTLVRKDGSISARYAYNAWGEKRHESGDSFNRFGFTGHEHDTETGLIYAKARYYDPDAARFLSQDPFAGIPDIPPSLHKYLYAYQNPTVFVDPDGRFPVLEGMADRLGAWSDSTLDVAAGLENNGANVFTSAAMGLGAGMLSTIQFAVGVVNTGADLLVDNIADENSNSFLVQESRRSLGETRDGISRAIEFVAEDPARVGTQLKNSLLETASGFASGDNASVASAFRGIFELAAGGKGIGGSGRVLGEATDASITATRQGLKKLDDLAEAARTTRRVKSNVEASSKARTASRFSEHASAERTLAAKLAERSDVARSSSAENHWSPILQVQKQVSLVTQRKAAVVDRWLASSNSRLANAYRQALETNPGFASMIRGRVIDRRMNTWFQSRFGDVVPGVRIDQVIPGSGKKVRPDLYFPDLDGSSVIFDIGGKSKISDINKYSGMADYLIPVTH